MRCNSQRMQKGFCFPVKPTARLCLFLLPSIMADNFCSYMRPADSCDLSEFEMHHSKLYSCSYDFGKSQQLLWWARLYRWPDPSLLQLTIYLLCSASLGHVFNGIWCGVSFLALSVWCSVCVLCLVHFSFLGWNFFYDFMKNIFYASLSSMSSISKLHLCMLS